MPNASLSGADSAGGLIAGPQQTSVLSSGNPLAVKGDPVMPHGLPPCLTVVMVGSSGTVFAEGKPIVRAGDSASCGHPATGSSTVNIGS
jgi:uncharacterized Zn-binding protein involved in type VI secretion